MSSKLHRGFLDAQPILWQRAPLTGSEAEEPEASSTSPPPEPDDSGAELSAATTEQLDAAYREGQQAARKEMTAQWNAAQVKLARTMEEAAGAKRRFRQEAEEDVVRLAMAIARRILHRELTVAPEALAGLLKAALEKIDAREVYKVRVRPEDVPMIRQFLEKTGMPQRIDVAGDPSLEWGAAVLESSRGSLDASVDTQLSEIERGFADLVRRA